MSVDAPDTSALDKFFDPTPPLTAEDVEAIRVLGDKLNIGATDLNRFERAILDFGEVEA